MNMHKRLEQINLNTRREIAQNGITPASVRQGQLYSFPDKNANSLGRFVTFLAPKQPQNQIRKKYVYDDVVSKVAPLITF